MIWNMFTKFFFLCWGGACIPGIVLLLKHCNRDLVADFLSPHISERDFGLNDVPLVIGKQNNQEDAHVHRKAIGEEYAYHDNKATKHV